MGLLYVVVFFIGGEEAFDRTGVELGEDDPEFVSCIPPATCLPVEFVKDLIDFFLFQDLELYAWVRVLLLIVVLIPLILGIFL